jgi:hypothetical protein
MSSAYRIVQTMEIVMMNYLSGGRGVETFKFQVSNFNHQGTTRSTVQGRRHRGRVFPSFSKHIPKQPVTKKFALKWELTAFPGDV